MEDDSIIENGIAIIGMSGRFPGANSVEEFWENLTAGVGSISSFPDATEEPNYVGSKGVIENIELFDANFFGFSKAEAEITDPQHRIFLECAWEALEKGGYCPKSFPGAIGVYGGCGINSYFLENIYPNKELQKKFGDYLIHLGNEKDFLTTRVSYKLNLKGPSLNIQTACSTSLVAICTACNQLLTYQCDMALAGGVSISASQNEGYVYQEGMIFSPDGACRPFDAKAEGTVPSNGAGIVLLKRFEDAQKDGDHIYGVIRGFGINNDGSDKVGFSAPSVQGQTKAIQDALEMAEVDPKDISYVEAHGTGTKLGDPIEIKALSQAFGSKEGTCSIGSVKGNIGHLIEAAGVAGLIKTTCALHHQQLPPSLHFESPNPNIHFEKTPFSVNTKLKKWESTPRRAGVSSFGMGGTNAHLVMEEAPEQVSIPSLKSCSVLTLSAKTETALFDMVGNLKAHLKEHTNLSLEDVAYTLAVGRESFKHRLSIPCSNPEEAIEGLVNVTEDQCEKRVEDSSPQVIFLFTGQGSQYVNMAKDLYKTERLFRKWIDYGASLFKPRLGIDLKSVLYPEAEKLDEMAKTLNQTSITQAAIFVLEYALAKLWMDWGLKPMAMIGHSLGEYAAACIAGVFSFEDAVEILTIRGTLMEKMQPGSMLAVPSPLEELQQLVKTEVSVAAVNHPKQTVLSGPEEKISEIEQELKNAGLEPKKLRTSLAFHSKSIDSISLEFESALKNIRFSPPQIPYISNLSGTWITPEEATSTSYWVQHMRETVHFSKGIETLLENPNPLFIEIGPGPTLANFVRGHLRPDQNSSIITSLPHPKQKDEALIYRSVGEAWKCGAPIDWSQFYKSEKRCRVPLPTYPFQRERYWIDPMGEERVEENTRPKKSQAKKDLQKGNVEEELTQIWKEYLGSSSIGIDDSFFDLGGDSLLAVQLVSKIDSMFDAPLKVHNLLEANTIRKLAKLISSKSHGHELEELIVPLRKIDGQKPLFFVHPIGGSVLGYKSLADLISTDHSVYGIQSLDSSESPETIEAIASMYIEAIRKIQPVGPYSLFGASFGGLIAYEMAQQLKQAGESVDHLTMADIVCPSHPSQKGTHTLDMISLLTELFAGKSASSSLTDKEKRDSLLQTMGLDHLPQGSQDKTFSQIQKYTAALTKYEPKPYSGNVLFFEAKERYFRNSAISVGKTWKGLIPSLEINVVPGNHLSMLNEPNVGQIGLRMSQFLLDKKLKRPGRPLKKLTG